MEDGHRHVPRSFSNRHDFESHSRAGDSALALFVEQRRIQRLCRRLADLGCDAVDHTRSATLAASASMKLSRCTMYFATFILAQAAKAGDAPARPEFKLSRQDEDWSALRDTTMRADPFDSL